MSSFMNINRIYSEFCANKTSLLKHLNQIFILIKNTSSHTKQYNNITSILMYGVIL